MRHKSFATCLDMHGPTPVPPCSSTALETKNLVRKRLKIVARCFDVYDAAAVPLPPVPVFSHVCVSVSVNRAVCLENRATNTILVEDAVGPQGENI